MVFLPGKQYVTTGLRGSADLYDYFHRNVIGDVCLPAPLIEALNRVYYLQIVFESSEGR